jgi:hypothetical protein
MRSKFLNLSLILLTILAGCADDAGDVSPSVMSAPGDKSEVASQPGGGNPNQSGVITAGEWNDLDHWRFWETIIEGEDFKAMPSYWTFFNNNRVTVNVVDEDSKPIINALVKLKRDGTTIFTARTDNMGKAELWADLYQTNANITISNLTIDINDGSSVISTVKMNNEGSNTVTVSPAVVENKIEIAFVVDATGSMGDELEYLKMELQDVLSRAKAANHNASVSTSSVFYRDDGDEYVTKVSDFTSDIGVTTNFIQDQSAGGGGDFPEAVHTALDKAVNTLQWSTNAKARLLFLVLDAPPHHDDAVISNLQASTLKAAEKGIKIIPITASGIDKETEFLMRFLSISTNGTYVFITDHSGVGDPHLQATVGEYEVEYLNNLMVRLINKYAE